VAADADAGALCAVHREAAFQRIQRRYRRSSSSSPGNSGSFSGAIVLM
jgi:hypothetical protein